MYFIVSYNFKRFISFELPFSKILSPAALACYYTFLLQTPLRVSERLHKMRDWEATNSSCSFQVEKLELDTGGLSRKSFPEGFIFGLPGEGHGAQGRPRPQHLGCLRQNPRYLHTSYHYQFSLFVRTQMYTYTITIIIFLVLALLSLGTVANDDSPDVSVDQYNH